MLAVPSDRAAATRRQRDGVRIPDLDKDVVGAWPRSVDRSDQALAALIGSQVANRAPALVGTTFLKAPGKATAHVAFIESGGGERKIVQWRGPVRWLRIRRPAPPVSTAPERCQAGGVAPQHSPTNPTLAPGRGDDAGRIVLIR